MNSSILDREASALPAGDADRRTKHFVGRFPIQYGNSFPVRFMRQWCSAHISPQSPIIIGGCPRSGTTLTRIILDAHPNIACGPESSLLTGRLIGNDLARRYEMPVEEFARCCDAAQDHAQLVELFFSHYATRQGKTRWAEKTPSNIRHLDFVLRHFPKARVVHVIRDGRDLVCSLRTHPKTRLENGQLVPTNIRRPLDFCIRQWLRNTAAGMAWRGHPNYMELRYEDLVQKPEPTIQRLCGFIGEPWLPALMSYHASTRQNPAHFRSNVNAVKPMSDAAIGRWRQDLTEPEQRLFYRLAGRRLLEFDYC